MVDLLDGKLTQLLEALGADGWAKALRCGFYKQDLPHELFDQLMEECQHQDISSQDAYLLFCRKVTLLAFFCRHTSLEKREDITPLYLKVIHYQYPKEWQIGFFYKTLIALLLGEHSYSCHLHLEEGGAALMEHGGCYPHLHLPNFIKNIELALIATLVGLLAQDHELLKQVHKMSSWIELYAFSGKAKDVALWTAEKDYQEASWLLLHLLLVYMMQWIACGEDIQKQEVVNSLQSQLIGLSEKQLYQLPWYHLSLYHMVMEALSTFSRPNLQVSQLDQYALQQGDRKLGYSKYVSKNLQCYCSASGVQSGFAAFRKDNLSVVSIGPHFAPLGSMERYGIYRTPLLQPQPFKDVRIEQEEDFFSFNAWTRLLDEESLRLKPGSSWLSFSCKVIKGQCVLNTKWVNFEKTPKLFLAFFVKASKVVIDKNYHLQPYSLNRYEGKVLPIHFHDNQHTLSLYAQAPSMQVIPLAGGDYFWGAQFLVAYHFPKDQELVFEMT